MNKKGVYYISPFNLFYGQSFEKLGPLFSRAAYSGEYTLESEHFNIDECLKRVIHAYELYEEQFYHAGLSISELIYHVVKELVDYDVVGERNKKSKTEILKMWEVGNE